MQKRREEEEKEGLLCMLGLIQGGMTWNGLGEGEGGYQKGVTANCSGSC